MDALNSIRSYYDLRNRPMEVYDIVIIGAGPAGCACALVLRDSGLKVLLIDKSTFPREKRCGDAIPGEAIKALKSLSPEFAEAFDGFPKKNETRHTIIRYKQREIRISWVLKAYTCRRLEFDQFLLNLVREKTKTDIITGTPVATLIFNSPQWTITTNGGKIYQCKVVVGADGANSVVARKIAPRILDKSHYVSSISGYYEGFSGIDPAANYFYLEPNLLPAYYWVFPLPDGLVNVGTGMRSDILQKRKLSLNTIATRFQENIPALTDQFKNALPIAPFGGYGLPLGSSIRQLSGEGYLLTGDAASLIDPATGSGIGNAMISGKLAGETIKRCFTQGDISAKALQNYDRSLLASIGKELRLHYLLQRLLTVAPWIIEPGMSLYNIPIMQRLIKKLF